MVGAEAAGVVNALGAPAQLVSRTAATANPMGRRIDCLRTTTPNPDPLSFITILASQTAIKLAIKPKRIAMIISVF
jgi:hypothetical protein